MALPKPKIWPPFWFLIAILAMVALNRALPGGRLIAPAYTRLGWLFILAGAALNIWGSLVFRIHRTTPRPFTQPSRLIAAGPFRLSRNPLYLSLVLILAGVALFMGTLTPWLVLPLFIWVLTTRVIRVEEQILEETFGEEYRQYRRRVRRWI